MRYAKLRGLIASQLWLLIAFIGLAGFVGPVFAYSFGIVAPASVKAWEAFRAAQPFQTQVVAISAPAAGAPRTLIISEPPPRITWDRLLEVLGAHVSGCETRDWYVMSGGSVTDVVCSLKATGKPEWAEKLAQLQLEIYGSTEGASAIALPAPKRQMIAHSLDLRYGAQDLHTWLVKGNQQFRSNPLSPSVSLQDLLDKNVRGVFLNQDRSLVIWAIDRGKSIDNARTDIRRFAVAGDQILGAVANERTVVIASRARLEPLAHLPPLRSETVLLLAGSSERELAQSYERQDVIAGKSRDGTDRAPILLSPQLVDTEFGTLLNIADQLLKGWSMAGNVQYARFRYPPPRSYPFGDVPAYRVKPGRSNFLFNWNTDGAAYRQTVEGLDVVAPQRTGSLSVIYGDPRDRPRDMEDVAYDYFAKSGDVSLVRVVQYTLLFQIFRQFDISATPTALSLRYQKFSGYVDAVTRRQFKWLLSDVSDDELTAALRAYWTAYLGRVPDLRLDAQKELREVLIEKNVRDAVVIANTLRHAQEASQGKASEALGTVAAALRRRTEPTAQQKEAIGAALGVLKQHLPERDFELIVGERARKLTQSGLIQVAMDKLGSWQTLTVSDQSGQGWNRTAYVVESKGKGEVAAGVGGHNLNAPMIQFLPDPALGRGAISARRGNDGGWVVSHNPNDSDRLRTISREVGTRKELAKEEIESQIARALKDVKAEPPVKLAEIRQATGKAGEFKFVSPDESNWRVRQLSGEEQQMLAALSDARHEAIVMEQLPGGEFVLSRTGSAEVLEMASITAATDALATGLIANAGGKGAVSVLLTGMPEGKAEAMMGFVQASLRRYPKQVVDHVLASASNRALIVERTGVVNARIAHNGLRVDRAGITVEKVTSGEWRGFTRVEVPITIQAKTPWYLRLVFFIRDVTAASVETLVTKVNAVMLAIKEPVSPAQMQALIRRQLQSDLRDLQIDAVLMQVSSDPTRKVHDIVIAVDKRVACHAA